MYKGHEMSKLQINGTISSGNMSISLFWAIPNLDA